jgi:predicted O-methyltransferase YrrM
VTAADAKFSYPLARLADCVGLKARAAHLYRAALAGNEHERARPHLARLELPGEDYFRLLERLHAHLRPRNYIEVGVATGKSLRLAAATTRVLGVDPEPRLKRPAGANVRIHAETSDDFFAHHDVIAELGGERLDLALIDGLHQFEFALRDFMNLERLCHAHSVILVHDCYPLDERSASRERRTQFWSGDVWRMLVQLVKYRPDLSIHTLATSPTGLGLILNPDPASRVLEQHYARIIAEGMELPFAMLERDRAGLLRLFPNDWSRIRALLDGRGGAPA